MSVDVDDDKFKKVSRNSPNKSRGVLKILRKGEINGKGRALPPYLTKG